MNTDKHALLETYWLTLALMNKLFEIGNTVAAENLVDTANELRDAMDAQGINYTEYACEVKIKFTDNKQDSAFQSFIDSLDMDEGSAS